MRINEKVAHLKEHHFSEWLKTRQVVEDRVSQSFSMFCLCGRLATGLHERSCRRFQAKVDSETAKALAHLLIPVKAQIGYREIDVESEEGQRLIKEGELLEVSLVKQFTDDDLGKWFTYVDGTGSEEKGKLKNFNNDTQTAWIVYKCNENWDGDHWKDYTAQATNYQDIKELR